MTSIVHIVVLDVHTSMTLTRGVPQFIVGGDYNRELNPHPNHTLHPPCI